MRKKIIGFLAVFACFLMLTGCGSSAQTDEAQEIPEETRSLLYSNTEMTIRQMDQVLADGTAEDYKDYGVIYAGIQSWESAKDDLGAIDLTTDADGNGSADCFEAVSITVDGDDNYIVTVRVTGDKKEADVVATYYKDLSDYANLVTNVNYTKGELLQRAGLNTLLGMGTTFFVLILLSLIITAFGNFFVSMDRKKAEKAVQQNEGDAAAHAAVSAEAPAVQKPEFPASRSDEGALIAVIAAAVSACREQAEPAADPGDFVVRRIRRIGRK